jgi:hypothetical protein
MLRSFGQPCIKTDALTKMTNERFEFRDGKLYWISDEDTLIVEGWPSLQSQYIQGTSYDPFWVPHKEFPDALIPQSRKSLARLLYPARIRLVLGLPVVDVPPDDPRYYTAPFFTDRLFRERSGALIDANRAPLQQFLATIPPRHLDEIIKYECQNAIVARALALDERLYDLSVSFPILFLLAVTFAHFQKPSIDHVHGLHNPCFGKQFTSRVDDPDAFLNSCAERSPIDIMRSIGHEDPEVYLDRLQKYSGNDLMRKYLWRANFGIPAPQYQSDRWDNGFEKLNSHVMTHYPYAPSGPPRKLLDQIIKHPYANGRSTETFSRMYDKLLSWSRPAGGGRLSLEELSSCGSAAELRQLYQRVLAQVLAQTPKVDAEIRFPVNTPELRPILYSDDLNAAMLENLYPDLFVRSGGEQPFIENTYMYRVLAPVKGILECGASEEYCVVRLYLDCGAEASEVAAREFWLKACRETDWTGHPDELRAQAFQCILPSNPEYSEDPDELTYY